MINDKSFLGLPTDFQGKCWIFPPTVKEAVGNSNFYLYIDLLTKSQEEIEDIYAENGNTDNILTPLEFLMSACYHSEEIERKVKEAFEFFIHNDVTLLYEIKTIIIGKLENTLDKKVENIPMITEENFFDFQNAIRVCCGMNEIEKPNIDEHPKIRRMKALARYRDKVKARQAAKHGITFGTNLVAICCMGLNINPLNIGELSYASVGYLTKMYQNKEEYETSIQSLMAGADPKKVKPNYWIRKIE